MRPPSWEALAASAKMAGCSLVYDSGFVWLRGPDRKPIIVLVAGESMASRETDATLREAARSAVNMVAQIRRGGGVE